MQHELGILVGAHRKQKELLGWVKKKKRRHLLRKEDIMHHLVGGAVLAPNLKQQRSNVSGSNGSSNVASNVNSMASNTNSDLATFREALISHSKEKMNSQS